MSVVRTTDGSNPGVISRPGGTLGLTGSKVCGSRAFYPVHGVSRGTGGGGPQGTNGVKPLSLVHRFDQSSISYLNCNNIFLHHYLCYFFVHIFILKRIILKRIMYVKSGNTLSPSSL